MDQTATRNGHQPETNKTIQPDTDPLQMLAKQCDTISGDEEKGGGKKVGKNSNGQQQQPPAAQQNGGQHLDGTRGGGQQKGVGGKAKSPNKQQHHHLIDHQQCLPSPSSMPPFPNGFPFPPHPAQIAALMNPFLQQRPPQGMPPPPPFGHHPNGAAGFGPLPPPPNGPFAPPPHAQLNLMQQLMAAVQQQMPPPHLLPGMFVPPHSGPPGIPLPPSMPMQIRKPDQAQTQQNGQAEAAEAAALAAMAMFPPGGIHPFSAQNALIGQQQQMPPPLDNNCSPSFVQQLLQQPVQSLLMAAACGQLPQFPCFYKMPGGALCGRVFPSDDQLFAHFKSAHIAQMSSPSAVSSTTEGPAAVTSANPTPQTTQTPTTATGGGGKMRATGANNKSNNSPSSSRSTPTGGGQQQQQGQGQGGQKAHSNPGPMVFSGWPVAQMMPPPPQQMAAIPPSPMGPPQAFLGGGGPIPTGGAGNAPNNGQQAPHRFHPYMPSFGHHAQQNGQQQQKMVPPQNQPNLQQMAMALNLMASGGLAFGPNMLGPADLSQSQSLAALAAMANSLGGQPTTQANNTAAPAPIGAGNG